jgi:hypothetical protein
VSNDNDNDDDDVTIGDDNVRVDGLRPSSSRSVSSCSGVVVVVLSLVGCCRFYSQWSELFLTTSKCYFTQFKIPILNDFCSKMNEKKSKFDFSQTHFIHNPTTATTSPQHHPIPKTTNQMISKNTVNAVPDKMKIHQSDPQPKGLLRTDRGNTGNDENDTDSDKENVYTSPTCYGRTRLKHFKKKGLSVSRPYPANTKQKSILPQQVVSKSSSPSSYPNVPIKSSCSQTNYPPDDSMIIVDTTTPVSSPIHRLYRSPVVDSLEVYSDEEHLLEDFDICDISEIFQKYIPNDVMIDINRPISTINDRINKTVVPSQTYLTETDDEAFNQNKTDDSGYLGDLDEIFVELWGLNTSEDDVDLKVLTEDMTCHNEERTLLVNDGVDIEQLTKEDEDDDNLKLVAMGKENGQIHEDGMMKSVVVDGTGLDTMSQILPSLSSKCRHFNTLNHSSKQDGSKWTKAEDCHLLDLVELHGKNWSLFRLREFLPGRPESSLEHRYDVLIRRLARRIENDDKNS